ncbi:hypothetical protein KC909_00030 [Candidatus Dojkabacteria bacterium]|uniref:Uncharacterized protein n=1 Tax=Candidatus Dojkabacteria bacterium TaxID=2099670 RepID=A0A955L4C0_9BACT|nr:hypothetical protein [Candidatus Dojkabacteria bacterium]
MSELVEIAQVNEEQLGMMSPVVKPYVVEIQRRYGLNLFTALQVAVDTESRGGFLAEHGVVYDPSARAYIASRVLTGQEKGELVVKGAMAALTLNEELNGPNEPGHKQARMARMYTEVAGLAENKTVGQFGGELQAYTDAKKKRNIKQTRRMVHGMRLDLMYQHSAVGLNADVSAAFIANMGAAAAEIHAQGFITQTQHDELYHVLARMDANAGQLRQSNPIADFYRTIYSFRGEERFLSRTISDVLVPFEAGVQLTNLQHYKEPDELRLSPFDYMVLQALGPSIEFRKGAIVNEVALDYGIQIDQGLIDDFFTLIVLPE